MKPREIQCAELVQDNPTRALVAEAVSSGRCNVLLDVNPALTSLSALLVDSADGVLRIRFTAPRSATQGNGVVAGGTLASMLDMAMAMGVLARLKPGFTCATIGLNANMLAAGYEGDFLAVAGADRVGRQIAFAYARLYDGAGAKLIATGTSSLAVISPALQD